MRTLHTLSMIEALTLMKKKQLSPIELVQAHIKRSEQMKELNAYITTTYEIALAQAKESEARYMKDEAGIIDGIPIAVKDGFCTKGVRTTAGSRMLNNFIPGYESTVTQNLFKNGGIMVGKTNMDEFAMGSSNLTSYFGHVTNPWKIKNSDTKLVPGGSSGGSAVAVAAGFAMGSLGSDTGGSVRQPASFTGTVGLKPTYGRCSRYGMIAFASSLDQAGTFTKTVADSALLLQSICGYDDRDATSKNIAIPDWFKSINHGVKGLRIGIPKEYKIDGMHKSIEELWATGIKWLKDQGAIIEEISLPHTQYALNVYYVVALAEASSNFARYDGVRYGLRIEEDGDDIQSMISKTRGIGFGDEVKRRLMIGTYFLSSSQYASYCLKAQKVRNLIKKDFLDAFEKVDAILTPTTPSEAFAIGEKISDPVTMYLNDIFTVTVNLAGLPAISIPAGLGEKSLPLGLQVIGRYFDEATLFKVGQQIELAANFQNLP